MGIQGRLIITIVALTLLAALVPVVDTLQSHRYDVTREMETRAAAETRHLAESLGHFALKLSSINDAATVQSALKVPDVVAAYALDPDGIVLTDGTSANLRRGGRLPDFDDVHAQVYETRAPVVRRSDTAVHVSSPVLVGDETFGFVHLVMSLDRARASFLNGVGRTSIIFAGVLLAAALLALASTHILLRPVRRLLHAVSAIKDGNFKVRLPAGGEDVLGRIESTINDITDNMRSATIAKRYLDEVLQSMVDSLIVVGTDANIVTVNRATVDMLGYQEKQLVGQPAGLIIIDEGYQLNGARLAHLLGEQTQSDHELMYRSSAGEMIPVSFSGSPIRDNTGEVVGYVCIGKDITDRKRAETEREQLNKRLVETSRQAGMAEVATGVLHNVGNVLNSVNMSATVIVDTVKRSKLAGLNKALELMSANGDRLGDFLVQDDKGRQLPAYLEQVAQHLVTEQTNILGELNSLTKNIDHIKEIINMQQSYSKVTEVMESIALSEILDEALRLNANALERHGITVQREVAYVPPTRTDKHKVLQVIVNLISNAKDAMKETEPEDRILTLRIAADEGDAGMVRIEVRDRGIGIEQENLTRIFTHGFTTKSTGHGFGLHSAALTAKELGGSLEVYSDGAGEGATFTLKLPLQVGEVTR